ncbi:MAG: response regulator transcription factor [Catenulispora sp.]|nr:response regulator transcription factor [Catenulispora sp.]
MTWRLLVVDDDPAVLRGLRRALGLSGFAVETAAEGESALAVLAQGGVDAVVLDVSMPGLSGVEVVRRLRRRGDDVPVLMLSALDDVADRIAGLAAGADDYVVKPFSTAELELRLRALLRRGRPVPHGVAAACGIVMDTEARTVTAGGSALELTRREFDVLEVLVRNAGAVLTRDQLLDRVWGYDFQVRSDAVDTVVSYLRRKLEAGGRPRVLHTVRGLGFALRGDMSEDLGGESVGGGSVGDESVRGESVSGVRPGASGTSQAADR